MYPANNLSWATIPVELLLVILNKTCLKSLISCMAVNKRWRDVVIDYIERHSLWSKIVSDTMPNKGRHFKRRIGQSFSDKEMVMNSILWTHILHAKIDVNHKYPSQGITRIRVDKEKLILTADPRTVTQNVTYYNITNREVIKSFCVNTTEIDFRENDQMIVMLIYNARELRAWGKVTPDTPGRDKNAMTSMKDPILFRLEDNVCYIHTKQNLVWAITWDKERWHVISRGRYYGNAFDLVCDINVYNDKVCLLTKLGYVLCEDPATKSYHKVNGCNLVASIQDNTVLEWFSEKGLVLSAGTSKERIKVCKELKSDFKWLECAGMTCATEYGLVVFIGYNDGTVAICTPHTMSFTNAQPDKVFNVRDFDSSIEQPSIVGVEVFEERRSHRLFVATKSFVFEFKISYPDYINEIVI